MNLFGAIDKGVPNDPFLMTGFNGGLFAHDELVDDLQLDDRWTGFFKNIGTYDFRDEVNVDVLGHIFEKSIGELEQVRIGGLFGNGANGNGANGAEKKGKGAKSAMPKSAERKRFGIYYTPPEFTEFIVRETLGTLIDEQQKEIRKERKIRDLDLASDAPSVAMDGYWRACLARLRTIKVCDPACGSGAFLIQAYDQLEVRYREIVEGIAHHSGEDEKTLLAGVSDWILNDNLHGVDLSEQAVEITQLALWLRSADNGRKLADLSHNIVWGNSLVTDPAVHAKAMKWADAFPAAFKGDGGGFHAVIGNPPWERMKLQEREFFAHSAPSIAGAVSAADRRKQIAALQAADPELFERYKQTVDNADRTLTHVRTSGEFPLTAKGDINTYMLFAELARKIVAPSGRVGLLVPSGIATDNTTREFFNVLMEKKALAGLYDFENRLKIFPDVDGRFKFTALLFGGSARKYKDADFFFFAHEMADLKERKRHIALTYSDMALVNPNTKTCPIFRTRRDAELTKEVYRNVPILIDHNRKEGGNPWGIKFSTMFHQTNDAELFIEPDKLQKQGFKLTGNRWVKGKQIYLPLYEAKMIQAYDHRAASVVIEKGNWMRQGQTEDTSMVAHQNPDILVQPRWWVDGKKVESVRGATSQPAYLCFKDVTSPTNQRTVIGAMIPNVAVVNSAPLMLHDESITPRLICCLLGNFNSLILDFIARQKVGGLHLNFFIVEEFPMFHPDRYEKKCPWDKSQTLEKWISDRVLKLTCTANDMKPLAKAAGFDPPVHKWDAEEREQLMAELDAAFFRLYGIQRDDVEYILGTFQGLRDDAAKLSALGIPSQTQVILEAYDRLVPVR